MTKIRNNALANTEVVFSFGKVLFDADGIADITPDENAQSILSVPGFYSEEAVKEEVVLDVVETEDQPAGEVKIELNGLTEKELDALAVELEVKDYPKGGNKGTKKAAIGAHLAEANK